MAERVDLHVGMPRAGTKVLQTVMRDNADALKASGVDLVVGSASDLDRAAQDLAGGGGGHWQALVAAVQASPERVLLSWHGFSAVGPAEAKLAVADLAPAEVRVICTLRDPTAVIPLIWQQQVRAGGTEDLDEFATRVRAGDDRGAMPDPVGVADAWAGAVSAERLHLVVVPPASEPGLWELFAAAADLDGGLARGPRSDEGAPDAVALELLRRVNLALGDRLPGSLSGYRELIRPLLRSSPDIVNCRAGLTDKDHAWATSWARAVASGLGQRPYEIHGDLAHLIPAPPAESAPFTDDAVATLGAEIAAGLLVALRSARRRIPEADKHGPRRRAARA